VKRDRFFSTLGIAAGTLIFAPSLISCSKNHAVDLPKVTDGNGSNSTIDFKLDLSLAENLSLKTAGGSLIKNGIIIGRTSDGSFVAASSACTHQGFTLAFESANKRFHCANHGANFGFNGSVLNIPAETSPLKIYNTQLVGTLLRVFG
jgi:cytochrome b6-f complex iron-sulfur subunit